MPSLDGISGVSSPTDQIWQPRPRLGNLTKLTPLLNSFVRAIPKQTKAARALCRKTKPNRDIITGAHSTAVKPTCLPCRLHSNGKIYGTAHEGVRLINPRIQKKTQTLHTPCGRAVLLQYLSVEGLSTGRSNSKACTRYCCATPHEGKIPVLAVESAAPPPGCQSASLGISFL